MSTSFPTSLDNYTDPSGSDTLGGSTPTHSQHHANLNDAVEALEAKVGANSSAVTASHDYKLANGVVLKTLVDAKGDLLVGTANDTVARKAAGANDRLLIADSSQADGLRWATPAEVRTALALVPGTDVEAHDADLTTIAGLTATTDNVMQAKAGAWASRTLAQLVTDLAPLMPGVELGYASKATDTTSASGTYADVTGVTTTVTVGTRPIVVIYGGIVYHSNASGICGLQVLEDGVSVNSLLASAPGASGFQNAIGYRRLAPSAGAKTYKLQFANISAAGTATLGGSAAAPSFVHVVQA